MPPRAAKANTFEGFIREATALGEEHPLFWEKRGEKRVFAWDKKWRYIQDRGLGTTLVVGLVGLTRVLTFQDAQRPGDLADDDPYKDFVVGGPQDALTREVAAKKPQDRWIPSSTFATIAVVVSSPPTPSSSVLAPVRTGASCMSGARRAWASH